MKKKTYFLFFITCRGEQLLEQMKDCLDADKERERASAKALDKSHRLLVSLKEGANHLYETLKDIKLTLVQQIIALLAKAKLS